jgi:hypothetical protein
MAAIADQVLGTDKDFPQVSSIMLCLDEAKTFAASTAKANRTLNEQKIPGENNLFRQPKRGWEC